MPRGPRIQRELLGDLNGPYDTLEAETLGRKKDKQEGGKKCEG